MSPGSSLSPRRVAPLVAAFILTFLVAFIAAVLCLISLPGHALAQVDPAGVQAPGEQVLVLRASQDTTIDQAQPDSSFGADADLRVGVEGVDPAWVIASLIQWDLSAIPRGSTILSATLGVFQTTGGSGTVLIYRAVEPWDAAAVAWNTQPKVTIVDRTWTPPAEAGQYVRRDVTALVDQWVNGGDLTPNDGLLLAMLGGQLPETRVFASREAPAAVPPVLRIIFTLPPIRVCYDTATTCKPVAGAEVLNRAGVPIATSGTDGLIDSNLVKLGDALWARLPVAKQSANATLYQTSGITVPVEAASFQLYPDSDFRELRLVIRPDQPLLLYNLDLTSQWYLEDDPVRVEWLRSNLLRASDYLFDFTEGQFALGTVTVHQMYEGWDAANIKLHTSNVLHPNANVGGIVLGETPDFSPTVPISYTRGSVFMGSYWNRFGEPPDQEVKYQGQVVPPEAMADDWAIALAHELSHYLLFLFDTYTDANGVSSEALAEQCAGSAMGNAYLVPNHAFIADQAAWDSNCGATEAYARLLGRTEWATITGWYNWAITPQSSQPGVFPPVPLTSVVFVPPAALPQPLASQVYSLTYQLQETSSGEARAFLLRDDSLIFEQGQPAEGTTTVQLTDARVGDRLCAYDVNDHAEDTATPRHQFGCEIVTAGDSDLVMTRNQAWNPLVTIQQTGSQQISIDVRQALGAAAQLRARLIPETGPAMPAQTLVRSGNRWTAVFNLSVPVMPFYLQLWVEESPAAPQTRREVIADRGTGGNGSYGPARLYSGVLAVSSDGNASYQSDTPIELGPGESIAWQSMPGTPPLSLWLRISGQSYRLDAFPASLVDGGTVSIRFEDQFGVLAAAESAAVDVAKPAIYFWNESEWVRLSSTIGRPADAEDGVLIASAPSQGTGVYAVLIEAQPALFAPFVQR